MIKKNIQFIIREAMVEDINESFFKTIKNLTPLGNTCDVEKSKIEFERGLSNPDLKIFVAVNDVGEVIGTIQLVIATSFHNNWNGKFWKVGFVGDFAVRKGFEGNGIGRALMGRVKIVSKELDIQRLQGYCADKLLPFYKKFKVRIYKKYPNFVIYDLYKDK